MGIIDSFRAEIHSSAEPACSHGVHIGPHCYMYFGPNLGGRDGVSLTCALFRFIKLTLRSLQYFIRLLMVPSFSPTHRCCQIYYSSVIHFGSSNPRHLRRAVKSPLYRKCFSPLPNSISSPLSLMHSVYSSQTKNLIPLLLTAISSRFTLPKDSPNTDSPLSISPTPSASQSSLPVLSITSEAEVSLFLTYLSNKQCEFDPCPNSLLNDCDSVLVPVVPKLSV